MKEDLEKMDILKKKILGSQKTIDKKRYKGGKIEKRTEYYSLIMRKKETSMMAGMQKKFGSGGHNSSKVDQTMSMPMDFDSSQPVVSKEQ